jgi:hypothetical protein
MHSNVRSVRSGEDFYPRGLTFAKYAKPEWEGKRALAFATRGQALVQDLNLSYLPYSLIS